MGLSLPKLGKKLWDQINPLDSGRTFQNQTPQNNRSAFQQAVNSPVGRAVVAAPQIAAQRVIAPVIEASPYGDIAHAAGNAFERVANAIPEIPASSSLRFANNAIIRPYKTTEAHFGQALQGDNPYHGSLEQQAGQAGQDVINAASVVPVGKVAGIAAKGASIALKVAQGAEFGAKAGAGFGAAQGIATSLQDELNLPQAIKTTAQNTAIGAGLGAGVGIAAPVAGAAIKPIVKFADQAVENRVPLNQVGAVGKLSSEDEIGKALGMSKADIQKARQAQSVQAAKQINTPKGVGMSQGVKDQLQPTEQFKRDTVENTQLNPLKVDIPEAQPGDYQMARTLPTRVSNPIQIQTNLAVDAAKKLSKAERAQIPHLVEGTMEAKTPQAKAFVRAHNDLTNLTHATSQSLGGNTNFVPSYFRHNVDLSNPADAKRWEELVAKRGGQAADPYAFGGIDNMNRVFKNTKELENAGFHLKNSNNPIQNISDYGASSASTLRKQALIKGIVEADMDSPLKNRNFDLGDGRVVPVSEQALRELKSLSLHDPSTNKAAVGARTLNAGLKSSILSYGQFHPMNISVLRAGPSIAMPKVERLLKGDLTLGSHPVAAVKGVGATFRPLFPGGKGAVSRMYKKATTDTVVDPGTGKPINYVDAAAQIGAPYGARGYEVAGTKLKSGAGHKLVFERQMPMMHNQVIRSVVKDLVKDGVSLTSPEARQAGIAANSTMGFINKEVLNISPKTWQAMNDFMLANQFTPSKVVTLGKVAKKGVAGQYARADVASNVISSTALIAGLGYLANQKSDSIKDSLLRALVNPAIPTPWKDKKGNNVELRTPLTYTGEISHLLGIKLHRNDDGHLGVTWNPGNAKDTIPEWAKARLSPLAGTAVKIATNKNFADKPLYDENAPIGTKAIQAATTLGQGFLPIGAQGLPNTKVVKDRLPQTARDILENNTPGSNPVAKSALGSVGFSPRTDQTTGKALSTSQYFEARDKFAKSLSPEESTIFNKIAAPKKDSFGNKTKPTGSLVKVADYGDLVANQSFADKYHEYQKSIKNHDPLWDLDNSQLRSYMQAQVISKNDPGGDSDTVKKLYARLPEGFFGARDKYFADLKSKGASFDETKYNSKPGMPDDLVKFSADYHNLPYGTGARSSALRSTAGQKYIAWLDQNKVYTNQERADLGLPPLEDTSGGYASGGKSRNYSSAGSGGSSGSGSAGSAYKYAISAKAGGSIAKPKVSAKISKTKKTGSKVASKSSSKIKVTKKKSLV